MANLINRFLDGKISLQDYEIEGKSITQTELLKLQELYKSDFTMIDRTRHYKKQFIGMKHFRIHIPTWRQNVIRLLNPFSLVPFFIYHRKWFFLCIYFLMMVYILQGVLGLISLSLTQGKVLSLISWVGVTPNSIEYWTPVLIYCLLCFIYATQMSTWTEGVAETKRITKLESLQLLVSLPHRKQETFLVTAKEIAKCLVDRIETNPSKKNSWRGRSFGISLLALTLTSFYLLLPFLTKSKTLSEESEELSSSRISIHPNHHLLLTFGKHLFITINITLRYLFDFLFLFGLFSELFISLDYLWKRMRLLRMYSNVTSEKGAARYELYHIKLNTPENIICWAKIRKYLQAHNSDRFVFFQVLLAILSIVVISLLILLLVRLRHTVLTLLDYKVLYLITVFGLYLIVILWIGGLIDFVQKQHINILRRQKWKLQRHIIQYNNEVDSDIRRRLDFSHHEETLKTSPNSEFEHLSSSDEEIVFSDEETEKKDETLAPSKTQFLSKTRSRLSLGIKSIGKRKKSTTPTNIRTKSNRKESVAHTTEEQDEYNYDILDQDMNVPLFEQQKRNRSKMTPFSSPSPFTPTKTSSTSSSQKVLSPTALSSPKEGKEKEIVEQCQTLLSKLVEVLQQTDRPLHILMLRVDYSLAVKVMSVLFSAIVSRILRSALA